jgi:hypothetical protein
MTMTSVFVVGCNMRQTLTWRFHFVREPIVSQPKSSPSAVASALSADMVEGLAALVQVPILDTAMAERIAGGAAAAIAAVQASSHQVEPGVTFECEPSDYLRVLETLAGESP